MNQLEPIRPPAAAPVRLRYLVRGDIAPVFVERHALSADDAIAFVPANPRAGRRFAAMLADGSIREPSRARFYFDMAAYEAAAEARSRRMVPWLIVASIAIAVVAVSFYVGG